MNTILLHEQHIITKDLGVLHLLSESPVPEATRKTMLEAAETIYYQYGAGVFIDEGDGTPIIIRFIDDLMPFRDIDIVMEETMDGLYLVNPYELVTDNSDGEEIYLMSEPLRTDFLSLLKGPNPFHYNLILETWNQKGLFFGVVSANYVQ